MTIIRELEADLTHILSFLSQFLKSDITGDMNYGFAFVGAFFETLVGALALV